MRRLSTVAVGAVLLAAACSTTTIPGTPTETSSTSPASGSWSITIDTKWAYADGKDGDACLPSLDVLRQIQDTVVYDGSGTIIGLGDVHDGKMVGPWCVTPVVVDDLPASATIVTVKVGTYAKRTMKRAEAEAGLELVTK